MSIILKSFLLTLFILALLAIFGLYRGLKQKDEIIPVAGDIVSKEAYIPTKTEKDKISILTAKYDYSKSLSVTQIKTEKDQTKLLSNQDAQDLIDMLNKFTPQVHSVNGNPIEAGVAELKKLK
jgi:hypothetical protein